MAKTEGEVRRLLADFCRKVSASSEMILAEVVSTDITEKTCVIVDDGAEYYGVRLQPITGGNAGIVLVPKVKAFVLVSQIEGGDLAVVMASEYESISIDIANTKILMDKDGIVVNNGDNNGMVKIDKLIEWMSKVHNDLISLKTMLATHTVVGNGSPLKLMIDFSTPRPIKSDFEDTRFKH